MRVYFEGMEVLVNFEYSFLDNSGTIWHGLPSSASSQITTNCSLHIFFQDREHIEIHGKAVCREKDTFFKSVGRKLSLLRALESCDPNVFSDDEVETIWNIYNKQHNDKKNNIDYIEVIGTDEVSRIPGIKQSTKPEVVTIS